MNVPSTTAPWRIIFVFPWGSGSYRPVLRLQQPRHDLFRTKQLSHAPQEYLFGHPSGPSFNGEYLMTLRTARERVIQTLAYEVGGLAVATPLYALAFGIETDESALVLAVVSVAMVIWSPIHNTLFDLVEWRTAGRNASDRPHFQRVLHALSHEGTSAVVTVPILMLFGDLGIVDALLADIGLSVVYTLYAYIFHCLYDRLRPIHPTSLHTAESRLSHGVRTHIRPTATRDRCLVRKVRSLQ